MKRLWAMGGVGLSLGLAGCAATQQRGVLGPGGAPGASHVATAHSHPNPHSHVPGHGNDPCGCGPVQYPTSLASPSPVRAPGAAPASQAPSPAETRPATDQMTSAAP